MRGLASLLLLVTVLLQLLLGGLYLMSSRYQPTNPAASATTSRTETTPGRQVMLGVVCLAAALAQVVGLLLGRLRRMRRSGQLLVAFSAVPLLGLMVVDGAQTLLVLALVLTLLASGARVANPPTA